MADRKKTPKNLLDDLLGGKAPTSEPAPQDAGIPVSQDTSTPASQQDGEPAATTQELEQPPGGERPKATYYLSQETLDGLDEAWLELRKMSRPEARGRVSKSAIVEQAILLALNGLEDKGRRSPLARNLLA